MFDLYLLQVMLEEAEKDYKSALHDFEEIGINKHTLKRLIRTNMMRRDLRQKLQQQSPKA